MPTVDITIRNNIHPIACDDGQESHLRLLSSALTKRVDGLSHHFAKASDLTLVILTALMLEDELMEIRKQQKQLSLNIAPAAKPIPDTKATDAAIVQTIETISEYVEQLANRIEKS